MAQSITSTAGLTWPAEDFSRVPYGVFTSQQVCELMGYDANGGGGHDDLCEQDRGTHSVS